VSDHRVDGDDEGIDEDGTCRSGELALSATRWGD